MTDVSDDGIDQHVESTPTSDLDEGGSSRVFGGVAAVIADRLGVDPFWVRIGFIALTLSGGVGLLIYAGAWLAFVAGEEASWRWVRPLGGLVLIGGVPLMLHASGIEVFDGAAAIVLLLGGLALALWQPRAPRADVGRRLRRDAVAMTRPTATSTFWFGEDDGPTTVERPPSPPRAAPVPKTPRVRPEPSLLGRTILGVAVIVAAAGAMIDQANGGRLHPEQWLGAGAVVCGLGLLVGALRGRARWLVVPALLLGGAGYVGGVLARVGVPITRASNQWISVSDPSFESGRARTALGNIDIGVDVAPRAHATIDARVGFGDVRIWASNDITVELITDVQHGDVRVRGEQRRVNGRVVVGPEGDPDVTIDARVGHGDVFLDVYERYVPQPIQGTILAEGAVLSDRGELILADGETVIGPNRTVIVGDWYEPIGASGDLGLPTSLGDFELRSDGTLLTPFGERVVVPGMATGIDGASTTTTAVLPTPTTLDPTITTVTALPGAVDPTPSTTTPTSVDATAMTTTTTSTAGG